MCSMNIVASDEIFYLHLTSKAANNGCHQMCSHTWYKKKNYQTDIVHFFI